MEGKIFGIPVIIIVLALVIAALVDIPMFLLHVSDQANYIRLSAAEEQTQTTLSQLIPVATPTASPSATPVPVVKPVTKTFVPAATTTGKIK